MRAIEYESEGVPCVKRAWCICSSMTATHTSNNLPATVGEFVEVDVVLLMRHDDPGLELVNLSWFYLSGALARVGRP